MSVGARPEGTASAPGSEEPNTVRPGATVGARPEGTASAPEPADAAPDETRRGRRERKAQVRASRRAGRKAEKLARSSVKKQRGRRVPRSLEDVVNSAVTIPSGKVHAYVDSIRTKYPGASPEDVIAVLERRYMFAVSSTGGAVGAAAAIPGLGTGVALALTGGQVATFLGASALLSMAVADVHGIEVDDVPRRRAVLLTALLGPKGPELLEKQIGLSTATWGRALMTRVPLGTVKAVNRAMRKRVVAGSAAKAGSIMLGRLMPFGVGAVIGYTGGRLMGNAMIRGIQGAFGPPPRAFLRPIDAELRLLEAATPPLLGDGPDQIDAPQR